MRVTLPEDYREFFVAAAGASGALIGLLFVAVSVFPERARKAATRVEYHTRASTALVVFTNALVLSLTALVPNVDLGWWTMVMGVIVFAFAAALWLAVGAYWATSTARQLAGPPYATWLNNTITDSRTRATVLSITSVFGSAGEWAGGPVLGWIGTRWSVRSALAIGAVALTPVLALLGRAAAHQGREPELADTTDMEI